MRVVAVLAALLMLAACDQVPDQSGSATPGSTAQAGAAEPAGAFDYRYAFRIPFARIADVQDSHAKGCEQLGPGRCKITAIRYAVDDENRVTASLTLKLDPTLARAYGEAAARTVKSVHGTLIKADIAGVDSAAAKGRSDAVIQKLRDALGNTEAQLRSITNNDQRTLLSAKADRLRGAIATIGEIDQGAGSSVATTPVLITYVSGGVVAGGLGSADNTFDTAWQTLQSSLAGLFTVLAGVGPWLVLLLGGALILRRIVQGPADQMAAPELPPAPRETGADRNVIQRWFARDDHPERETAE
ncbi:MAG: hypothetical protein JWN66_304 [Sphingomonas bacterium]|jgi:hypothetical protein|uniref:hypothetical protein n=1 Tax=Sphingomonas bacterium TaxID=1895847 RepID=UPI00262644C6|nr:hypothetical protein [Sphingomonas bacterium]MDB5703188.1 hypothetical protein [Sphingomonas bacterium]